MFGVITLFYIPLSRWPNTIHHVLWQIERDFPYLQQITSPKSGRLRCRWKWLCTIGWIILTTENYSERRKPVPVPLCPPQIWHRPAWDRTRVPAVTPEPQQGQWTWNLTWIKTQSVPRRKNTLPLGYTNKTVNVVYGNNRCLFWDPHKTQISEC
jgi:hypothetical protein